MFAELKAKKSTGKCQKELLSLPEWYNCPTFTFHGEYLTTGIVRTSKNKKERYKLFSWWDGLSYTQRKTVSPSSGHSDLYKVENGLKSVTILDPYYNEQRLAIHR